MTADAAMPTPAAVSSAAVSSADVTDAHERREARVMGAAILGCYLIDAALLAAYAALGSIGFALPVVYALTGLCIYGSLRLLARRRTARQLISSPSVAVQTLLALVLVNGAAWLQPQIGLPMVLTSVSILVTAALRLSPRSLMALVVLNTVALAFVVMRPGVPPVFPVQGLGECVVTGLFLVWTLLKGASINVVGNQLRSELDLSHAQLSQALAEVERLAQMDELTGLPNRRSILRYLSEARERSQREGTPLGVGMLDIDFFKRINDEHGHPTGDEVLRTVGGLLRSSLRTSDRVGRIGGEEFLVLLDSPFDVDRLQLLGERMRAQVAAHDWPSVVPGLQVSASIGLTLGLPDEPIQEWLDRADRALYRAKAMGRNRVELEPDAAPTQDSAAAVAAPAAAVAGHALETPQRDATPA